MDMELAKLEVENRIGSIIMCRSEKRNALSYDMVTALKACFEEAESRDDVKVIILSGEGKAFSAGADLKFLQNLQDSTKGENLEDSNHLRELFELIYFNKKIVIALVQGHAIAGGCGLATVCDFVFAVPEARFGYTEVRIGFVPAIVMFFLIRKVGEKKAKELLLAGNLLSAQEAFEFDLINQLIPANEIEAKTYSFASELCENCSGEAMGRTKQMIGEIQSYSVREALSYAAEQNAEARATDDCKRGVGAFLNKEKISW